MLPPSLATARLLLRGPRASDAADIFRGYTQDPLVSRYMIWRPHETEEQSATFIASCVDAWETGVRRPYVITELGESSAIGMLEARPSGHVVDCGYVLARSHWGKGYMPEALAALADAALSAGYFRVQAYCDVENRLSQRALEKAGFLREGRMERYLVHPNVSPDPRACFMYAKCRAGENAL